MGARIVIVVGLVLAASLCFSAGIAKSEIYYYNCVGPGGYYTQSAVPCGYPYDYAYGYPYYDPPLFFGFGFGGGHFHHHGGFHGGFHGGHHGGHH